MTRLTTFIITLTLLFTINLQAQTKSDKLLKSENLCATHLEEAKLLQNPAYAALQQKKKEQYRKAMIQLRMDRAQGLEKSNPPIYTLPVVVHIFHAGADLGSEANPTDASVINEITTASQRFRHQHAGAVDYSAINSLYGADTEIEFCLASTDQDGNYTTGIIRYYDTDLGYFDFGAGESVSEYYATLWPTDRYINLFIIQTMTGASGVYFGGADATFYDSGVFWSGLIAHEVGHYFSLGHTFQGGCTNGNCLTDGDDVCDTPPKAFPGFNGAATCSTPVDSCFTDDDDLSANNPYRPVADGGLGNQPDMIANYLDYTGSCWDAFTQGQKDKMRNDITTYRMDLVNSNGCNASTAPSLDAGITLVELNGSACTTAITPTVTLFNYGTATLSTVTIILKADGSTILSYNWSGSLASQTGTTVILPDVSLAQGSYLISAETSAPNGGTDGFTNNDISFRAYTVSGSGSLPYAETFESGTFPPIGIVVDNPDASFTWVADATTAADCNGGTNGAISVDNYSYNAPGQRDILRLPTFDLSAFSSATLIFDVAYAPYSASGIDGLNVEVSNACGTPGVEYSKTGLALATNTPAAYVTPRFEPACTEWRTETVNLDAYTGAGFTQVIIDLVNINGYGNYLFLDNINFTATSACTQIITVDFAITAGSISYIAGDYVTGNNTISGTGTNVTFSGTNYVELQNGFQVMMDSEFLADNNGCGNITSINVSKDLELDAKRRNANEMTQVEINLNQSGRISLFLYDAQGKKVLTIKENEWMEKGTNQVNINTSKLDNGNYSIGIENK